MHSCGADTEEARNMKHPPAAAPRRPRRPQPPPGCACSAGAGAGTWPRPARPGCCAAPSAAPPTPPGPAQHSTSEHAAPVRAAHGLPASGESLTATRPAPLGSLGRARRRAAERSVRHLGVRLDVREGEGDFLVDLEPLLRGLCLRGRAVHRCCCRGGRRRWLRPLGGGRCALRRCATRPRVCKRFGRRGAAGLVRL